jgi:preprotein translocase subunit SecD
MINQYPLWKNLIVLVVVLFGIVYSLPNIYPPDYALQVSMEDTEIAVSGGAFKVVTDTLDDAGISYFGAELDGNSAVLRFPTADDQLKARSAVQRRLADEREEFVVALFSAETTPQWLQDLGADPMKYGLDLRGGVHFLMEVDTDSVVKKRLETLETDIKRQLREARLRYKREFETPAEGVMRVLFDDEETRNEARTLLEGQSAEYTMLTGSGAFPYIDMTITEAAIREMEDFAVSQNVQTIRNRVNELGVAEPLVQRLGRNRIVVDLPGVQDPTIAKSILGKVATLEFRLEAEPNAPRSTVISYPYEGRTANLERRVVITGERVVNAQPSFDPESGLPQVSIDLDGEGGNLMHRSTKDNIGRRLGVVFIESKTIDTYQMVDGVEVVVPKRVTERRVISLATIQAALAVKFRITGLDSGEARELALLLRAGALAADMYIVEERTVGASLGAENVQLGAISIAVGLALVLLFMIVYYKVFGIAANLALVANLSLLVAVMSSFGFTLTLPGMAGIVLTVGMAVDANVLIFSRIKEEIANGMSPQGAINAGFDRAFTTILDANITTLLVAVILYSIGTGPVKGFAVTLSIGIVTSMFTAIMGTRAIINLVYGGHNIKKLAI